MPSRIRIYLFILIGLFVGSSLDLLIRWEVTTVFYYGLIVIFGFLYAFAYNERNSISLIASSFIVSLILSIPLIVFKWHDNTTQHLPHLLTLFLAFPFFVYVAHCFHYAYHQDNTWKMSYVSLFAAVWNTIVLLIVAILFEGIANGLIILAAYIFKTTGNDYLWNLCMDFHFRLILNSTLIFIGLAIGQENINIIYNIRFLLLKMMYYLFPLLALISTLYLILHLIQLLTGGVNLFNPLFVLIPLSVMGIIFFNAYYQDGDTETLPSYWLDQFLKAYRVILFILVLMMTYNLFEQFPINSNVLIILMCALFFSITYAITAYLPEPLEKKWVPIGNISTAWFFLLALFMFNIPYLPIDFSIGKNTPDASFTKLHPGFHY